MVQQHTIVAWLNDVHILELSRIPVLENHITNAKGYPHMQAKLSEHLEQTHRHIELVRGCIERLGGSTLGVEIDQGAASVDLQHALLEPIHDELVKSVLGDYVSEHIQIASYSSLIAASAGLGDQETARICIQIQRDEQAMAVWLEQQIPLVTREFLLVKARQFCAQ